MGPVRYTADHPPNVTRAAWDRLPWPGETRLLWAVIRQAILDGDIGWLRDDGAFFARRVFGIGAARWESLVLSLGGAA